MTSLVSHFPGSFSVPGNYDTKYIIILKNLIMYISIYKNNSYGNK